MPRLYFLLATSILAAIPALGAGWSRGENLLTTFVPSADEWIAYEKSEGNFRSNLWTKKGAEEIDSYAVSVIHKHKQEIAAFREMQDAPGRERCDRFESQTLAESPTNGYPRLVWRTLCENADGFTVSMLHVAIQGRDSFYHVHRIWRSAVPDAELARWQELLQSTDLCDTRRKKQKCPEGFERVEPDSSLNPPAPPPRSPAAA